MKNKHKKILKMAKGYRGAANSQYKTAANRVHKALQHAYRGRKLKKRNMRALWIQRMNAGAREQNASYAWLISSMNESNIQLNRKMMAELAVTEPYSFRSVVEVAKEVKPPPVRTPRESESDNFGKGFAVLNVSNSTE